jgi:hypothetical protein
MYGLHDPTVSMVCSSCGFLPEGTRPAWAGGLRLESPVPSAERLGQQEFEFMKKLLIATSVAAGVAAAAVPAFAQSAMTSQPDWTALADNGAAGSVQAQNYSPTQRATSSDPRIGDGSTPGYLMQQQELENMPGYSPQGAD